MWQSDMDLVVNYNLPQGPCHSVGKSNVKWELLIEPQKAQMPPLHIKLDIKQFVTALDISLTLILTNSKRTWELTQRRKASAFIKIYWTLNVVTKDSITKT